MNIHSLSDGHRPVKGPDRRGAIMQAALELIAEQGFHRTPMAEVAQRAGVATGTIYRYFESKDLLINELHRKLEERIMATLQEGYPSGRPLRERFLYLIRELLVYFMANPLHFRYMEQYYNSPYGISLHRNRLLGKPGSHDILMEIFEQGIERQVLKALPKAVLFSLAVGPLILLMRDHIIGITAMDDRLMVHITEACWDAIKR